MLTLLALSLGGQAIYTERPTITYVPMTGDKFLRGLVTPLAGNGSKRVPDCTGCDHDDFINPGAEIQIRFGAARDSPLPVRRTDRQAAAKPLAGAGALAEIPRVD